MKIVNGVVITKTDNDHKQAQTTTNQQTAINHQRP